MEIIKLLTLNKGQLLVPFFGLVYKPKKINKKYKFERIGLKIYNIVKVV